ncbi:MAG: diguanylate cyclase [Methylovulum sp.]|nr:diguanylate cyclase [Methylovulum sp.]
MAIYGGTLLLYFWLLPAEYGLVFLAFYPVLVISFYFCGIGPGAMNTLLSAVTVHYFFVPPFSKLAAEVISDIAAVTFLVSAFLIALIVKKMHRHAEQFRSALSVLQLSEERYRGLLENQTEIICRFKADGTVLYVNEAYCRLFGKPRDSLVGHKWHPTAWHEDIAYIDAQLALLTPDHPIVTIENRIIAHDGTLRWGQFVNRAFFDAQGQLLETQAVGRDITERKALEEKLAASAKEIEDLYDHAPCGYHSIGADGVYLRINATELSWLGCRREEVIGKAHITDFYTEAGKAQFMAQFPYFLKTGRIDASEYDLLGKDGTIRHVSLSATVIKDAAGNFLMSRGVMYDITKLNKAEAKLRQLMERQSAMLDNELIGICKVRNRVIIWKNKAMGRIFGYGSGELIGEPTRILYLDDASYYALGEAAYIALKAEDTYRTQLMMMRKGGEPIWVDLSAALMPGDGEDSLWSIMDITEIKKQQEQIEQIAYHDILTDLPNRLLLSDRLAQALAQAKRSGQLLAVCYLDLDGFKPVNDTFGHAAGDILLKEIAHRMQASVRAHDTVCRLGGDEFVLLLTNLKAIEEYQVVLERVITAIKQPVVLDATTQAAVTASIGITVYPLDDNDADTLLRHADRAMYQAKKTGRDCVYVYHPDIPQCDE